MNVAINTLSASQILALPVTRPDTLFADQAKIDIEYKTLAKRWHPDLCKEAGASDVLAHVNAMYTRAKQLMIAGAWGSTSTLTIETKTSGKKLFNYQGVRPFELGEIYVCASSVILACSKQYSMFCDRFIATTKHFSFANDKMKSQLVEQLPILVQRYEDNDRIYLVVATNKQYIRVADLIESQATIDPKHVAWILSRMYGMACYLSYAKLRHLDFSAESFYIVPETHEGALLGGWFYAGTKTEPPIGIPNRISLMNPKAMPDDLVHLSLIKETGKRLFKVHSLYQLKQLSIPKELKDWLSAPSIGNPFEEYKNWESVLVKCFGQRRFTEMKLTVADIYKE